MKNTLSPKVTSRIHAYGLTSVHSARAAILLAADRGCQWKSFDLRLPVTGCVEQSVVDHGVLHYKSEDSK